jgi:hypothetical protein
LRKIQTQKFKDPFASFGEIDRSLQQFGILQAPLLCRTNGDAIETGWKAIIKDDRVVAMLGADYQVLPNQTALTVAKEVARDMGAEPFKPKFAPSNAVFSDSGTRLYAMYLMKDSHTMAGGEKISTGFVVQNGIDGTLAFSCTGFTFRHMCSNGAFIGYKKLESYYRKHTSGFQVNKDAIGFAVRQVLTMMEQTVENYAKLETIKLNKQIAQKIAENRLISRKVIPDYIETKKNKLVRFDKSMTLWQTYNDITRGIWHNDDTGIDSKRVQFKILHQIIQV